MTMTKVNKSCNDNSNRNSKKSKGRKEEELNLCPICDDVCTCGQQQPHMQESSRRTSSTFKVTPTSSRSSTTIKLPHKSGSSFIWDFNVRGQLIPLENVYSSSSELDDDASSSYSTDADCSDLVSASESGDHLSDVLSEDSEDLMEDQMMVYYQHVPIDTPKIGTIDTTNQHTDSQDQPSHIKRMAAITPQVLAAISKTLGSSIIPNHHGTCVLLLSDDEIIGDDDGDIEMIIAAGSDGSSDENSPEDESDEDWSRFRRVPVNAFYSRSKVRSSHISNYSTANALRPSSSDPQFLGNQLTDPSSADDMLRAREDMDDADDIMEGDNSIPAYHNHHHYLDTPLIY